MLYRWFKTYDNRLTAPDDAWNYAEIRTAAIVNNEEIVSLKQSFDEILERLDRIEALVKEINNEK
jgi:hypothetical protein